MGADTLPTLSASQDPQPYGNSAHPARQDPTQYIIAVHWGDDDSERGPLIGSWEGQFDSLGYYFADGSRQELQLQATSASLAWDLLGVGIPGPGFWTASISATVSAGPFIGAPWPGPPAPPIRNESSVTLGLLDGVTGEEYLSTAPALVNSSVPQQQDDTRDATASSSLDLSASPGHVVRPFVRADGGGFYGVNFIGSNLRIDVFGPAPAP